LTFSVPRAWDIVFLRIFLNCLAMSRLSRSCIAGLLLVITVIVCFQEFGKTPTEDDRKFKAWEERIRPFSDGSKEHHKILWEVSGDDAVAPQRALEFILNRTAIRGTRIGSVVRIISREEKADLMEATRCYDLLKGDPQYDSVLHSLGTELGRWLPEYGLKWLRRHEYSRGIYFATVNLGNGFAEYAGKHPVEEIEPIFIHYLESSLFAGKAYDSKVTAEGSRMRERMTQGVLKQLALNGKLDDGLASRLEPKIPKKCIPDLDTYPLYTWPLERLLYEFKIGDFPQRSGTECVRVAHGRLLNEATVEQTVEWSKNLTDESLASRTMFFTYRHHILKAEKGEMMRILEGIEDPGILVEVADFAKEEARSSKDETLSEQIAELVEKRR